MPKCTVLSQSRDTQPAGETIDSHAGTWDSTRPQCRSRRPMRRQPAPARRRARPPPGHPQIAMAGSRDILPFRPNIAAAIPVPVTRLPHQRLRRHRWFWDRLGDQRRYGRKRIGVGRRPFSTTGHKADGHSRGQHREFPHGLAVSGGSGSFWNKDRYHGLRGNTLTTAGEA
jgi:hypothetical protein